MQDLETLIYEINDFSKSNFGFKVEKSSLKTYSSYNWELFCKKNGFNLASEGIYIPNILRAYVKENTDYFVLNIFHELFGHGLFCEHSLFGKKLCTLDFKEAEQYLYKKSNSGISEYFIEDYEGIAMLFEEKISIFTNTIELFNKKLKHFPNYNSIFEKFKNFEKEYSLKEIFVKFEFL